MYGGEESCSSHSSFCPLPSPALLSKISNFLCTPCSPLKLTVRLIQRQSVTSRLRAPTPNEIFMGLPASHITWPWTNFRSLRNVSKKFMNVFRETTGKETSIVVVLSLSVGLIKVIPGAAHDMTTGLTTQLLDGELQQMGFNIPLPAYIWAPPSIMQPPVCLFWMFLTFVPLVSVFSLF